MNRRSMLKLIAATMSAPLTLAAGSSLGAGGAKASAKNSAAAPNMGARRSMLGYADKPIKKPRIIVIGIGRRGKTTIARLVKIPGLEIVGIADLQKDNALWADKIIRRYMPDETPPKLFLNGPEDYLNAFKLDFDLAYICTPWQWHVPMAVAAMEHGAHAAVEVPIATTLDDCWQLVRTAEATQRHCMMLENVCYGETEMAVLNMCKAGVLGDLVHGEAAYIHDLRYDLVDKNRHVPPRWRLQNSLKRDGNLYPTHGLGPVAKYMDINGADHALNLVSMSSASMGIHDLAARTYGPDSPEAKMPIRQGDMNTTLIRTKLGRTIMVQFSTGTPRPYTRHNLIQGTRGIFAGYPDRLALDPDPHEWNDTLWQEYLTKYRSKDWERMDALDREVGGHGGMDTVMDRRLIVNLQQGRPMDISVYDSVLWSAIAPLSEQSVAAGSAPVSIPDFMPV